MRTLQFLFFRNCETTKYIIGFDDISVYLLIVLITCSFLKRKEKKCFQKKKKCNFVAKNPTYSKKRFLFNQLTFSDNIFDNGKSLLSKTNNIYGLTSPSLFWYWSNEIKCFLERLYHTVLEIWILGFYNVFRCTTCFDADFVFNIAVIKYNSYQTIKSTKSEVFQKRFCNSIFSFQKKWNSWWSMPKTLIWETVRSVSKYEKA